MPRQVAFLNENSRPHLFQEFFLFDDMAGLLDQNQQGFQVFWWKGDRLAFSKQNAFLGIKTIPAESV